MPQYQLTPFPNDSALLLQTGGRKILREKDEPQAAARLDLVSADSYLDSSAFLSTVWTEGLATERLRGRGRKLTWEVRPPLFRLWGPCRESRKELRVIPLAGLPTAS